MKIIVITKNDTEKSSFTASLFKGNLATHSSTEIEALEHLLDKLKERSPKYILSGDLCNEDN
jgi:hypothetical protein